MKDCFELVRQMKEDEIFGVGQDSPPIWLHPTAKTAWSIYRLIRLEPGISTDEISNSVDISTNSARIILRNLMGCSLIRAKQQKSLGAPNLFYGND